MGIDPYDGMTDAELDRHFSGLLAKRRAPAELPKRHRPMLVIWKGWGLKSNKVERKP